MPEDDTVVRTRLTSAVASASLATMLLLSVAAVGVQATTLGGRALVPQNVEDQVRRSVDVALFPESSPAAVWIVSTSLNAPSPDEFKITYNHGSFSLAYERIAGGPVTSQFTVTVAGLVEWVPVGDGQFSDGLVVARIPMGAPAFGKIPILHTQATTAGGVVVHSFLIQSNSQELTLNLTIAEGFVTLPSGATLTPMEAELTFQLNHVMNRTDTRLSIQLGMTTSAAGQLFNLDNQSWDDAHEFATNERAVNVTNNSGQTPSSIWFAWSNHAEVNGQVGQVDVTGPETNETTGGYDLFLSYPRTTDMMNRYENITHDPSLGVVSAAYQSIINAPPNQSGIQPDVPLYAGTVAAMGALVAGTVLLARRRRRERG
jgi:hypothetical protein